MPSPPPAAPPVAAADQAGSDGASELTQPTAEQAWRQALAEISGLKAQLAGDYVALAVSPPNQLVVTLKAAYNKEYCDRPDVKRELEQGFARQIGRTVRIEFAVAAPADVPHTEKRSPAVSRQQRMRELEQHPLVQEAVRLFDAEIVRVEERRGG